MKPVGPGDRVQDKAGSVYTIGEVTLLDSGATNRWPKDGFVVVRDDGRTMPIDEKTLNDWLTTGWLVYL